MARPKVIELEGERPISILYEDRSVLAIDKPPGWMIVPDSWRQTRWNLQVAIMSSLASGAFWARSRNLKFLRYVHRIDAETTGILLFARSIGAVKTFGDLFEERSVDKSYLAVVAGKIEKREWECRLSIGPVPNKPGVMQIDQRAGKPAETQFRVLAHSKEGAAPATLVEASPVTGRTHQIRLHLAHEKHPVMGDSLYGQKLPPGSDRSMALRSTWLSYNDPFLRRRVRIVAPCERFLAEFKFDWLLSAEGESIPAWQEFKKKTGIGRAATDSNTAARRSDERT